MGSDRGGMRGLEVGQRERLTTTQTDILTHITWRSSGGSSVADLDLCCLLLDNQGRILEVVDFNNPVSNDRAVSHGGDAVSSDDSAKSEQIFIDTRRFAPRVMACALTASQFTGTFGDVKLESADVTLKHLVFVGAAEGCSFNTGGLEATPEKGAWHALSSPREMIAPPKMSQSESKTTEIPPGSYKAGARLTRAPPRSSSRARSPRTASRCPGTSGR